MDEHADGQTTNPGPRDTGVGTGSPSVGIADRPQGVGVGRADVVAPEAPPAAAQKAHRHRRPGDESGSQTRETAATAGARFPRPSTRSTDETGETAAARERRRRYQDEWGRTHRDRLRATKGVATLDHERPAYPDDVPDICLGRPELIGHPDLIAKAIERRRLVREGNRRAHQRRQARKEGRPLPPRLHEEGKVRVGKAPTVRPDRGLTKAEEMVRYKAPLREPARLTARAKELGLPMIDYEPSLAMAIRFMDGGRHRFLQFVQLAGEDGEEDANKFMVVYQELRPREQALVDLDLVCKAAGISRVGLLKTVVGVAFQQATEVGNLVAAAAHPSLVETTVRSAKRLNSGIGQRDRHALLSHAGFLPTPKGAVINVVANAQAAASASASDPSVPSFLDDVNTASAARDHVQVSVIEGLIVTTDEDQGGGPSSTTP